MSIATWEDSPAAEIARALRGDRPAAAEAKHDRPMRFRTADEQRELRRQWEAQMDAADQSGPGYAGELGVAISPKLNPWRDRQQQALEFAEHVAQRGNWLGSGKVCPECAMEQAGHDRIHPADHECHREHLEIQQALSSRVKLQQAELSGAIQRGVTHPQPDASYQQMHRQSLAARVAAGMVPPGPSEIPN